MGCVHGTAVSRGRGDWDLAGLADGPIAIRPYPDRYYPDVVDASLGFLLDLGRNGSRSCRRVACKSKS